MVAVLAAVGDAVAVAVATPRVRVRARVAVAMETAPVGSADGAGGSAIGRVSAELEAVGEPVAVAVTAPRARVRAEHLAPVAQPVVVAVAIERRGADATLAFIAEPVPRRGRPACAGRCPAAQRGAGCSLAGPDGGRGRHGERERLPVGGFLLAGQRRQRPLIAAVGGHRPDVARSGRVSS